MTGKLPRDFYSCFAGAFIALQTDSLRTFRPALKSLVPPQTAYLKPVKVLCTWQHGVPLSQQQLAHIIPPPPEQGQRVPLPCRIELTPQHVGQAAFLQGAMCCVFLQKHTLIADCTLSTACHAQVYLLQTECTATSKRMPCASKHVSMLFHIQHTWQVMLL